MINDAFAVTTELEPQPHGGALKRSHAPDLLDEEPTERTIDSRQTERMALVPDIYKTAHERLACELAMASALSEAPEAVFARYGYSESQAAALLESPAFTVLLERVSKEIRESGLTFKAKAKAIAEELLPQVYDMSTDPLVSSAVRLDGIKWVSKMAGYEPKEKDGAGTGGSGLNLSITFSGQAPMQVVSSEPLTLEG